MSYPNIDRYRQRGPVGPQIHAVPDNEKAYDASGKRLPWGYETISPSTLDPNDRTSREPAEKGPFGRSTRNRRGTSRSRSKTAEPQKAEDVAKREQMAAEDAVFGSLRRVQREEGRREALGEVDANAVSQAPAAGSMKIEGEQEATEVLLHGFGEDLQWAAIDFYERVSGGMVLEDYDRTPPGQTRVYDSTHSFSRSRYLSMNKAALRKKNRYAGGDHWIKVTFSSRGAAELASARSPHVVKGHLVYAEPYQGRGPARDEAIPATQAGAQVVSGALPSSFSTAMDASPKGSNTVSSATAAEGNGSSSQTLGLPSFGAGEALPARSSGMDLASTSQSLQRRAPGTPGTTRIRGAQLAVLLPAEQALMPKQPKQSWAAWLGASELIGTTVPRKEDGTFDHERASLYWRLFYWLDGWLRTDFCGLRGDE